MLEHLQVRVFVDFQMRALSCDSPFHRVWFGCFVHHATVSLTL